MTKIAYVLTATTHPPYTHRKTTQENTCAVIRFGVSLAVGFIQKFETHYLHFSILVVPRSAFGITRELVYNYTLRSYLYLVDQGGIR